VLLHIHTRRSSTHNDPREPTLAHVFPFLTVIIVVVVVHKQRVGRRTHDAGPRGKLEALANGRAQPARIVRRLELVRVLVGAGHERVQDFGAHGNHELVVVQRAYGSFATRARVLEEIGKFNRQQLLFHVNVHGCAFNVIFNQGIGRSDGFRHGSILYRSDSATGEHCV